jgi:DNA-binding MarR family transcriptional regulator
MLGVRKAYFPVAKNRKEPFFMLIDISVLRKYALQYGHSEALVVAELMCGPATKEELAKRMGRTPRTIQSYLKPLVQAGIVSKDPVTHVWSLSVVLSTELGEKKSSITNIQTEHTDYHSNSVQNKSLLGAEKSLIGTPEETFCDPMKHSSQEEEKINLSPEHFKAARLASVIIFGQASNDSIRDIAKLLRGFPTIDMSTVAAAAHVVREKVRSNPIMMFIATYRNKIKAKQLLTLVKREEQDENREKKSEDSKNWANQFKMGKKDLKSKYDVFYKAYEKHA